MTDDSLFYLQSLDPRLTPHVLELVNAVRRAGYPLVVISGRRSVGGNREVGGAENSLHLYGLAVDLQVLGYTRDQVPVWWWEVLGQWWEARGGRWGGRFRVPDVNHFDSGGTVT